jgi:hypothetical protein
MFMFEGVVLNVPSAMQEPRDGFPPVTMFPRGTEEAPSPRRGFFFFGLVGFRAGCRRFACPGEGLIRDGLLQAACGSGAGKSEARLVGRASPLNAYDFPSRSRESRVKTIAVRAWRFSGGLKADWKQMGISPERCRKVTRRKVVGFALK